MQTFAWTPCRSTSSDCRVAVLVGLLAAVSAGGCRTDTGGISTTGRGRPATERADGSAPSPNTPDPDVRVGARPPMQPSVPDAGTTSDIASVPPAPPPPSPPPMTNVDAGTNPAPTNPSPSPPTTPPQTTGPVDAGVTPPTTTPPPTMPPPAPQPPPMMPPPNPPTGNKVIVRAKEVICDLLRAKLIHAKEISASEMAIGRIVESDDKRWETERGEGKVEMSQVIADEVFAKDVKCRRVEADVAYVEKRK
ncbi:MAG TPA: hypothetical protein VGF45_11620 [Polyangia bacterium]